MNRLDVLTHYLPDATPADLTDNDKLVEFDYTVRADGKRTAATETFWYDDDANGTLDPHVNQLTWTYDDAGRLTDEVFNHYDDLLDQTQHFTHDLTGNRLSRTLDKGNNGTIDEVFTSSYDENDRLQSEQADLDNDGTVDRTTAFGYISTQQTSKSITDNATSVVTQSTTYQYNLQGRMADVLINSFDSAGVQTAHEELHYEYDPTGIRVSSLNEQDTDNDGTFDSRTLTEYLIETRNHSDYEQVLQETVTDADSSAEIKKIVYTLGLDHIAQTVFESGGPTEGETLVFHMDGHGSTRVLTDMAAAIATVAGVQQIFHYDAYGNAIGFNPATAATSYLYSGEQFNATTGQQYLRARYYNSATGTFNRLDPFFGNFSDPQSLHKYLYTHANPINGVDPTGLFLGGYLNVLFASGIRLTLSSSLIGGIVYRGLLGRSAIEGIIVGGQIGLAFSIAPKKADVLVAGVLNAIIEGILQFFDGKDFGKDWQDVSEEIIRAFAEGAIDKAFDDMATGATIKANFPAIIKGKNTDQVSIKSFVGKWAFPIIIIREFLNPGFDGQKTGLTFRQKFAAATDGLLTLLTNNSTGFIPGHWPPAIRQRLGKLITKLILIPPGQTISGVAVEIAESLGKRFDESLSYILDILKELELDFTDRAD